MALLDSLFRRESEDPLAAFDENEASDLSLHVRQCGRRYAALNSKLDYVTKLIFALCILYALSNYPTIKALVLGH